MNLITPEIVELIMRAKARMPAGFKIVTIEEEYWIILHVDLKIFESFSLQDKIRIAETLNDLCLNIKETGIDCYVQKT